MRSLALGWIALGSIALAACATGKPVDGGSPDAGPDARPPVWPDAGSADDAGEEDSGATRDAGLDASAMDAGVGHVAEDAGADAATMEDAGPDGGPPVLDGGSCGSIRAGHTPALDGAGDLDEFPTSQRLTPGAAAAATDVFALTWDSTHLYVALRSAALEDPFKPLHVYVEARPALGTAAPSMGKEYGGQVPRLPFTPTHLIAVRRTSDSGVGGPYNGVYTPASSWNDRATPLIEGADYWADADDGVIALRVPWTALGCPGELRLGAHVVNGVFTEEWKDLVPSTATPWTAPGGGYYDIDLGADPAVSGWVSR